MGPGWMNKKNNDEVLRAGGMGLAGAGLPKWGS
jgi:hypothetical protein